MLVQNMPSLAVAMVVAREKNIEKKSIFLKFHETSKYHIFRKSIFSSCLKMFIDFFKGLTDISKSWNLNKKICNNHKLLCFEIQNNQKFQPFQKLQVLKGSTKSNLCSRLLFFSAKPVELLSSFFFCESRVVVGFLFFYVCFFCCPHLFLKMLIAN